MIAMASDKPISVRAPASQTIFLCAMLALAAGVIAYFALDRLQRRAPSRAPTQSSLTLADIPFDGQAAYGYLKQICALGPRPSGSPAMLAQQKLLAAHFEKQGGRVRFERFRYRHPLDGSSVDMANLIVQWHPETKERILVCAHYDTRPYPDQDPRNPRGVFLGANDGASGPALLMTLGAAMKSIKGPIGVDFALFDGEEFVFNDGDYYFVGSDWFARQYAQRPPAYRYRAAVLLDMVADADLQIFEERNSYGWPESRPVVQSIWGTAARLGVREFIPRTKHEVNDDHLKLYQLARIPACDIIDFDYPCWHTEQDTPAHCSALSLAKVGWVVETWLSEQR